MMAAMSVNINAVWIVQIVKKEYVKNVKEDID